MQDKLVKITNVRSVVGFDPTTLLPSKQVQITYTVGTHGPFTHVTTEDKFTPEYVEKVVNATAATLRAAGAVSDLSV